MCLFMSGLKQRLTKGWIFTIDVFTSGKKDSIWKSLLLFATCFIFSCFLSCFVLLYLYYTLDVDLIVAGGVAGGFGLIFTIPLFLSKQVRCFGTLFLISIFMKKSRTLLLTAGTSLVVFRNIRNTLENLTGLSRSLICNFKAKKEAITAPFKNYANMLKWIGNILQGVDLKLVNLDTKLSITPQIESDMLKQRLAQAEQQLNETVKHIQAFTSTVSNVSSKLFPAISLLILLAFIMVQVRKYRQNTKYQNKFITSKFEDFDARKKAEGRPHILPLTPAETKVYTRVHLVRPTRKEGKAMLKFCVPIATHFIVWTVFIIVDALLYFFVNIVTSKISEMEPFHVPLVLSINSIASVVGLPMNDNSQSKDFSYYITLFEKQCLPKPKLLLFESIAPLVAILLSLLVMAAVAGKLAQLRLMVCERFFTQAAEDRVEFLHAEILRKRGKKRREKTNTVNKFYLELNFWFPLLFKPKAGLLDAH